MELTESKRRSGKIVTVFATFLAFMGIGVVDPLLPVIAEQIGATHWQVEMLFTAYIFTMAVMMLPAGLLAGKLGDKFMMVIGLAIVTVFSLLCGFSNTISQLSIFRAGWGLGNAMFFATAMTLLIALSNEVSSAVGMYEAAIGLGMAGGPLVGGILGGYTWRYPFYATGILIFMAFILVLLLVREPRNMQKRKSAGFREMGHLLAYRPFLQGALAGMFYYYGFFTVLAYSPLILGLSAIQLGLIFFGWGLCLAYGSAVLSHQLERRWNPKSLIRFGMICFTVFILLLFFANELWMQIVLIILSGLVSGLNNALYTSYVMEVSPYARGITSGVYNFVRWLGAALAPILSGVIGGLYSPKYPFLVSGIVVFIGFLIMLIRVKQVKEATDKGSEETQNTVEGVTRPNPQPIFMFNAYVIHREIYRHHNNGQETNDALEQFGLTQGGEERSLMDQIDDHQAIRTLHHPQSERRDDDFRNALRSFLENGEKNDMEFEELNSDSSFRAGLRKLLDEHKEGEHHH